MELVTSWEERGIQRGLVQGHERGRLEEARSTLLRLGTKRFGPAPPETRDRFEQASLPELEAMLDRLLEAESWPEVVPA